MQKMCYPRLVMVCLCFLLPASLFAADENANRLSAAVANAHTAGMAFNKFSLFNIITGAKHSVLKEETLLAPIAQNIAALYESRPESISLTFTTVKGSSYTLEMMHVNPLAANVDMGEIHAGHVMVKNNKHNAIHYQGAIKGVEKSLASASVFADGTVMVLFANDEGNFVLGKLEDGTGNYVLYNDIDMIGRPDMPCGVSEKDYKYAKNGFGGGLQKTTAAGPCKKVQPYWEFDYQYYQAKGSLVNAQNYAAALFNQVQTMFRNDNITFELVSFYIWTTNDGYLGNTSTEGLNIFQDYWNTVGDGYNGDLAHFITMDNSSNGGLAYVDVLASRSNSYAYSEITGTFSTVPTYSWDVEVVTHETGHNLGSKHTQWCGWNTNSGSCGSIDNCATQESSSGCSSCSYKTLDNALPASAWKGSVMSYCHLVSRGINLANGFLTQPADLIRSNITGTPTLLPIINAKLTATSICNNDGAVSLVYTPGNFGTAPYTYAWSNSKTTQNNPGISTPGTYKVTITDANGCTVKDSADVKKYAKAGDGKVFSLFMPICCNTPVTATITANAPADLQQCQTIAWLRTTTPVSDYSAAQAAFSASTSANIIYSDNSSSLNSSTTADLTISSPASCVGVQSFYYTPFVSLKSKAANIITGTSAASAAYYSVSSTQIGGSTTLPDQAASKVPCDDTPTVKTLVITVTGYTGRAANMSIIVKGANNVVIYKQGGLAGNGTYTLNMGTYNPLQAMTIEVFDYNCNASAVCVSATANVSVTRTVTYAAVTNPTFEKGCYVGKSVTMSFAPNNCTPLALSKIATSLGAINIYPNPASKNVTVTFPAMNSGSATLKLTDMVGRVVATKTVAYNTGNNEVAMDVSAYAKGVYFMLLDANEAGTKNTKLVIE